MSFRFGDFIVTKIFSAISSDGKNSEFIFGDSIIMFIMFFGIVIFSMIAAVIFNLLKNIQKTKYDNKVYIKNVIIVGKRQSIYRREDNWTRNSYYITFKDEKGKRREFNVSNREYRHFLKGDIGVLHYRKKKYLKFTKIWRIRLN